jgi:hypothetical protein
MSEHKAKAVEQVRVAGGASAGEQRARPPPLGVCARRAGARARGVCARCSGTRVTGTALARRQVSRRTWDTEEYQRRADERREEEERLEREVPRRPLCLRGVPRVRWRAPTRPREHPHAGLVSPAAPRAGRARAG